jgi:hypothetical protein
MKVRYKKTGEETHASNFNVCTCGEVLTGDDSPFISELDVYLENKKQWKDMHQAFKDNDLQIDNYNTCFFEVKK